MSMRVIITCGPSYEPIDQVRRITNSSTGKLGVVLANRLARDGWEVICLKGVGATHPEPLAAGVQRLPFSTNDHLVERLRALRDGEPVMAVFHAAALSDFKVKEVRDTSGTVLDGAKLSSRAGELTITLQPATKVIDELRALFPQARIVGWKYELDGSQEEALDKGRAQIVGGSTDACVVNGAAYGSGFGLLEAAGTLTHFTEKEALCDGLAAWLSDRPAAPFASPAR